MTNKLMTKKLLGNIQLIGFDIDGVFTDGRFYLSNDGVESKSFHTQDGFGIRQLLKAGIEVAVISGRESAAVAIRMEELGVRHVHLGCTDKVARFQSILDELNLQADQSAYVGDDIPDLPILEYAGVGFAVANAVQPVKDACAYTTSAMGGAGAVREICDLLWKHRQ